MAIDYNDVNLAVINTMRDDATISGLVSTRVYTRLPKPVIFPLIVGRQVPDGHEAAVFGPPVSRVWNITYDFECLDHDTSAVLCASIHQAVGDLFEDESNFSTEFTAVSLNLLAITPGVINLDWVPKEGTWVGLSSFTLMIQE